MDYFQGIRQGTSGRARAIALQDQPLARHGPAVACVWTGCLEPHVLWLGLVRRRPSAQSAPQVGSSAGNDGKGHLTRIHRKGSCMMSLHLLPRRDVSRGLLGLLGTCLLGEPAAAVQQRSGPCHADADRPPWAEFGINIAGPALGAGTRGTYGKDYIYPDDNILAYYRSKGFKTVRVTFLWERLQPKLFATLATDELKRLQDLVNAVRKQDMVLITGPHNYARY